MKHPSYVLQMGGYDSYEAHKYNQMGWGPLDDLEKWGQKQVDTYISDPLKELGQDVGLTQEEIDRIAKEADKAFQAEVDKKQRELLAELTGQTNQIATGPSYTQQLQNQIADLQNQLQQNVPGGMTTVYAVASLLGVFVVYKIFAGPK